MMVWFWALVWVTVTTVLAVGGAVLVRRRYPAEVLSQHNDVAGFIYAVLGVIYAVLMASLLIASWEHYSEAESLSGLEAASIGDIYRDATALDPTLGVSLQASLRRYTESVVKEEWPAMAEKQNGSDASRHALRAVWDVLHDVEPATARESAWYSEILGRMNDVADYRQERLQTAERHLPALVWAMLLIGAIVVIGFSYLFGTRNEVAHLIMVGSLAAVVSFVAYTTFQMDRPFRGSLAISPEAFEQLDAVYDAWDATPVKQ